MVSLQIKCGYYFIWFLSDCVNNAAGLGFSGYDSKGNPQWDLASNVFILDMEFAMNLRTVANSWNVTTSLWLRRLVVLKSFHVLPLSLSLTPAEYVLSV